jgi:hypothetical protein
MSAGLYREIPTKSVIVGSVHARSCMFVRGEGAGLDLAPLIMARVDKLVE